MNTPNWINVLVYMVTVQSRHGIVTFNNQVFCLQRGDEQVEILDKELSALYRETSRTKNGHLGLNTDYLASTLLCLLPGMCLFCQGCVTFVRDLIKLDFESVGSLPGLADANMKYKHFRFDGHVSMLQLCVVVSGQTSTRIDHTDADPSVGCCLNTQSLQAVPAVWFRNCRVSQKLRPFLSLLSACVTTSRAGIPPWLRPRH